MKIENQLCTLEQAKRLKELELYYDDPKYAYIERLGEFKLNEVSEFNRWAYQYSDVSLRDRNFYSAFTVAELGVMLGDQTAMVIESVDRTEAESRAAHLIWLLEEKHLTAEEVNQRLLNA